MDGGAWWAAVHGVAGSQGRLSDFPFTFHFHITSSLRLDIPETLKERSEMERQKPSLFERDKQSIEREKQLDRSLFHTNHVRSVFLLQFINKEPNGQRFSYVSVVCNS